jgi:hypothetical protein
MLRADNVTVISVIFDPLDSSLSNNASCVIAHDMNMNLERAFTEHPEAMIRISHDACQILKTAPVELVYSGSRDTNTNCTFCNLTNETNGVFLRYQLFGTRIHVAIIRIECNCTAINCRSMYY